MSASYWLKSGAIAAVVIGGAGYFINAQFKADSAALPPGLVLTPSPPAPVPLSPPTGRSSITPATETLVERVTGTLRRGGQSE